MKNVDTIDIKSASSDACALRLGLHKILSLFSPYYLQSDSRKEFDLWEDVVILANETINSDV